MAVADKQSLTLEVAQAIKTRTLRLLATTVSQEPRVFYQEKNTTLPNVTNKGYVCIEVDLTKIAGFSEKLAGVSVDDGKLPT